jgi:ribonuclease PH
MSGMVSAISVGVVEGQLLLDLDYPEDNGADVDLNVVCASDGRFIEVQGSAERNPFSQEQFDEMLAMAKKACEEIQQAQKQVLGL